MKNKEAVIGMVMGLLISWPINHAINKYLHRQFMLKWEQEEASGEWAKYISQTNSQGNVTGYLTAWWTDTNGVKHTVIHN